ncbi:MAG TPA: sigma-70 family RNA polymerase sigma factor [Gemmatimonadales bacterium]|nr:sigma-70 family RNA polymerase sigma factor [Gemmatimonadales bacterium]
MARPIRPEDERALIEALRRRDEVAFAELVRRYAGPMLRLARMYARSAAVAEEVVQEAWLGVLQGIDRFEARSSFKTWLFRILVNRARTRADREARTIPFSSVGLDTQDGVDEPAVPVERFRPASDPVAPFHWGAPPRSWGESPEERLLSQETMDVLARAIAVLSPAQREVVTLRDVEGWTAEEVCNVLEISDTNQRVLLHRGRSFVRAALERHLDPN